MFGTRDFRDALGRFATGVTVVTTRGSNGEPVGVTVSSYNSVLLDPPLVLWSLARTSRALDDFAQSVGYSIHVLGADQQDLASRFAASCSDKFAGVDYGEGEGRSPLLRGCAAHFEYTPAYQYEGGDHIILVGKVARYEKSAEAPLVFHQGRFTRVTSSFAKAAEGERHGLYTDDFLPYLLGLAQSHLMRPLRRHCRELGLAESQYGTMGVLSIGGPATEAAIVEQLEEGGRAAPSPVELDDMAARGWIERARAGELWALTLAGRQVFLEVLAQSRAREEEVLGGFDPEQVALVKAFLRQFIEVTVPD